jgi:tRNA dimethylallyltransferase
MINPGVKLIAIIGPTASGKSQLALTLAERFNGEIICADSRTIYRDLDIATAKPTAEDQVRVPHHLLDLVDPDETLSASAFKDLAEAKINDVWARGKVPFLVGGSGLYIDALLFDYEFPVKADVEQRRRLELMTDVELRQLLAVVDPEAFERVDLANRRRVVGAIETAGEVRNRQLTVRPWTLVLGLTMNKQIARERISRRVAEMLRRGLLEEVRRVGETYGWEAQALTGIGYRAFKEAALGSATVERAMEADILAEMRLVRKQLAWFKRNLEILWLEDPNEAAGMVQSFLADYT